MKESILLHLDSLDILDLLSNEDAGLLFKSFKSFISGDEINLPTHLQIAYLPFKKQFDRDNKKYISACERNKSNGVKGGRPKKNNVTEMVTDKTQKTQSVFEEPKKPDNDKDNDKDKDIKKSIKENIITTTSKKSKSKKLDEAKFQPNQDLLQTDIETRKEEFKKSTYHLVDTRGGEYDTNRVKQFFEYWSKESIADNRYMFFEYEESFDVDVRMAEFAKRNYTSFERPKGLMKTQFLPPTQKEVQIFFDEKGYKKDAADTAFMYYELKQWIDANEKPVDNWKLKMLSVWMKPENKKEAKVIW